MVTPRQTDTPTPGFYLVRLAPKAVKVGACIKHDEDGWSVMINGDWQGPAADPWLLSNMARVAFSREMTTEADVNFRLARKLWAETYAPDHPAANPGKPIDPDNPERTL